MSINLLRHAKLIASATYVISIIMDVPAVSCTPKQIDLQHFCCYSCLIVSTSNVNWQLHNTNGRYYLVPPQSILTKQI